MKLIGSRTERAIEESLKENKRWLFSSVQGKLFLKELKNLDLHLKSAYILYSIIEQGEDIITFITDKKEIYSIEISRVNPEELAIVQKINFYEYKKNVKGRYDNLKMLLALKLIEQDNKEYSQ